MIPHDTWEYLPWNLAGVRIVTGITMDEDGLRFGLFVASSSRPVTRLMKGGAPSRREQQGHHGGGSPSGSHRLLTTTRRHDKPPPLPTCRNEAPASCEHHVALENCQSLLLIMSHGENSVSSMAIQISSEHCASHALANENQRQLQRL